MEEKILKNIKQERFHCLSKNIEKYISYSFSHEKTLYGNQELKFINFTEHLLQECYSYLNKPQSNNPEDVKEIVTGIQYCCQLLVTCNYDNINLMKVGRSFYHIISNLLKLKYWKEAIFLSVCLDDVIPKLFKHKSNKSDDVEIIVHNVYLLFWNFAIEVEKCEETHSTLKHALSLQFRSTALNFLCFKSSALEDVCKKSSKSIMMYIANADNNFSGKEISNFCTSLWKSIVSKKSSEWICKEDNIVIITCVLKMLKEWSRILIKHISSQKVGLDFLTWLDDVTWLSDSITNTSLGESIKAHIVLMKCSISFLLSLSSTENKCIIFIAERYQRKISSMLAVSSAEPLVLITDSTISVCSYFVFEVLKLTETEKNTFSHVEILTLDSVVDCITYLFLNGKNWIQNTGNYQQQLILLIKLHGGLTRIIREEIQKCSDADYIKELKIKAKQIIEHLANLLETKDRKHAIEEEYVYFGTEIGNLGIVYFGKEMYKDAIEYLELSNQYLIQWFHSDISLSVNKGLMKENLWKKYGLLSRCYFNTEQYNLSLASVVQGLIQSELIGSAVDFWIKLKRELHKKNLNIKKRTIKQQIDEIGADVKTEVIVAFLFAELKAYKTERYDTAEECYSIICNLLEMAQSSTDQARALVEMSRWIWIHGCHHSSLVRNNLKSSVEYSQEAIKILKKQLKKETKETIHHKFLLSLSYFWLYQGQIKNLQDAAQKEVKKSSTLLTETDTINSTPRGDEDDKEETCDISPAFSFVNICIQHETMEPLNKALQLWIELFNSESKWKAIFPDEDFLELLDVVRTTAEIFSTAQKSIEEIKSWSLLKSISKILNNPTMELQALSMLITALSRHHLLDAAKTFVNEGNLVFENVVPVNAVDSYAHLAKFKFQLAISEYLFHSEQFTDGLKILCEILSSALLERRTKSLILLTAEAKILACHYTLLSPDIFSITTEGNQHAHNLIKEDTPINLALESTKLCVGLLNHFSSVDSSNVANVNKDSAWYKPYLTRIFLESSLLLGKLYARIGAPREARYYLQASLTVAQELILANRAASILIVLAQVDFLCDNHADCHVKLNGLNYILQFNETVVRFNDVMQSESISSEKSNDEDEQEVNEFLTTKFGRSLKWEVYSQLMHIEDIQSSPPSQKQIKITVPSFFNHTDSCSCFNCHYVQLHCHFLEVIELQSSLSLISSERRKTLFINILKYHNTLLLKRQNSFKFILSFLFHTVPTFQSKKILLVHSDLSLLCHICCKLSMINANQNKYQTALKHLHNAFLRVTNMSKMHEVLYADVFCELILQKVIISLRYILHQRNYNINNLFESVWISNSCEEVLDDMSSITEDLKTLNVSERNNTLCDDINLFISPLKQLTKTPAKVSLKGRKLKFSNEACKAPIKKKFKNKTLEEYINSLNDPVLEEQSTVSETEINNKIISSEKANDCVKRKRLVKHGKEHKIVVDNDSFEMLFHSPNHITFQEINTPKMCRNKMDNENNFSPLVTEKVKKQNKVIHYLNSEIDDNLDGNIFSDNSIKTYSTTNKKKPTQKKVSNKNQKTNKCVSSKKANSAFKKLEAGRNTDSDSDFVPSPDNSLDLNVLSDSDFTHEPTFRYTDYLVQYTQLSKLDKSVDSIEDCVSPPELFRTGDNFVKVKKMQSRKKKSESSVSNNKRSNTKKSKCKKEQNRIDSESIEAVENVTRSSTSDDYVNPAHFELLNTSDCCFEDKFADVEHLDVKLEEMATELKHAISLLEHYPPCPLYSNMCILMSLLTAHMKEKSNPCQESQKFQAGYHFAESAAITLKHQALISLTKKIKKFENADCIKNCKVDETSNSEVHSDSLRKDLLNYKNKINIESCEKIQEIINSFPKDWTVVQVCTLPSGLDNITMNESASPVLLVTRFRPHSVPVTAIMDSKQDNAFRNNFLPEFSNILKESAATMHKRDAKIWWTVRRELDQRMKDLTETIENIWLGCWKGVFLGMPNDYSYMKQLKLEVTKILTTTNKLQLTCIDDAILEVLLDSFCFLRDSQLITAISRLWKCSPADVRCNQLLLAIKKCAVNLNFGRVKRCPVILILDKSVQVLPWESIPLLHQHPVCRVPSLSLLHTQLVSYNVYPDCIFHNGVNTQFTYYILNPSNDLPDTQLKFEKIFKKEKGWKGVIGRAPTQDEFSSALTNHDLFIYSGHGTGRVYLAGECIEKLRCRAATILMGCSSGKLKVYGHQLEATGVVLQYWLGGSPCVVANLWDVTDKDIDRFTEALLQSWSPVFQQVKTGNSRTLITDAIQSARKACRLPYLIGSAPVIYGLPVFTIDHEEMKQSNK